MRRCDVWGDENGLILLKDKEEEETSSIYLDQLPEGSSTVCLYELPLHVDASSYSYVRTSLKKESSGNNQRGRYISTDTE
jgi:hypothetical protein